MRDIKFRAWWARGGKHEMVYDFPLRLEWRDTYWGTILSTPTVGGAEAIMQYTGLKDKNGKEIYEGDILQDRQGKGEVKWIQEHCSFLVRVRKPHGYHKLEGDYQLNLTEVVGNIYENPELL